MGSLYLTVKWYLEFIKHIYSLLTYLSAKLFPLANPKFSTLRKRITSGKYFLIISHVLSDELLSMNKISKEILVFVFILIYACFYLILIIPCNYNIRNYLHYYSPIMYDVSIVTLFFFIFFWDILFALYFRKQSGNNFLTIFLLYFYY